MAFANLAVTITGNIKPLDAELKKAVERVKSLGSSLSSIGSGAALGISAPIAAFGAVALKSAGDLGALKDALKVAAGSASGAEVQFRQLEKAAKLPGLGLQEAIQGSVNLQAIGLSAQKSTNLLVQFSNAIAGVGGGKAELAEVVVQLRQLGSRAFATSEDLKPIIARVPQLAGIIKEKFGADALGNPAETFKKLGVSAKDLIDVFETELGKLARTQGGLKNDLVNLSDAVTIAMATAGEAVAPFAKQFIDDFAVPALEKLKGLAEGFKSLSDPVKSASVGFGAILVAGPLVLSAIGSITSNLAIATEAFVKLGGAVGIATKAFGALSIAAGVFAIVEIIDAFTGARNAASDATKANQNFERSLSATIIALRQQGVTVSEELVKDWNQGRISSEELAKSLRALAVEHGKTVPAAKQAGDAHAVLAKETAASRKAAREAEKDFNDLTRALQRQAREAALLSGSLRPEPFEIAKAKVAILAAELQQATNDIAAFQLKGFEAFDFPKIESASERVKDLTADLSKLGLALDGTKIAGFNIDLSRFDINPRRSNENLFGDLAKQNQKDYEDSLKANEKAAKQFSRQVSLITNDLARDISKLIFEGGKFGEVMAKSLRSVGESLARVALEKQFQEIAKSIQNLVVKELPSLARGLEKIFGPAGGTATTATRPAGATPGISPGAANPAGAVGSAASGLAGTVTAVASVGQLISSVIGNFQFAAINKSLDLVVKHTLQTANQLIDGIQPQVNRYLPYLEPIHQRLQQIITGGIPVFGGGAQASGGNSAAPVFQFQNCTFGAGTSRESIEAMFSTAYRRAVLEA